MVALIFHRLGPYHVARLRAVALEMEVLAIEITHQDRTYGWDVIPENHGFQRKTLFASDDACDLSWRVIFEKIAAVLDRNRPEAVCIPGWSSSYSLAALKWCSVNNVPAIMMSESTAWDEKRLWIKEFIKARLVGLTSAALVGGTPHADYIVKLGIPTDCVFLGYDAIDNDYFTTESQKHRRSEETLPRRYFLSSNRFIEKKNLFRLLEGYAAYLRAEQGTWGSEQNGEEKLQQPWDLCLLGDGELKPALLAHCAALGLPVIESAPWESSSTSSIVYLPGFRQIDQLPRFYAHAGAFVHASTTEQWGLVVNEAMASGLPVIVSNRVGCATDLVQEEVNGFTFDSYDVVQLADLLAKVSEPNFSIHAFGQESIRMISEWGPGRFAQGLKSACKKAKESGPKTLHLLDRLLLCLLTYRR